MGARTTLDQLQAIGDPVERALAVPKFIAEANGEIDAAREVRDAAIAELIERWGDRHPKRVGDAVGVSTSTVKRVRSQMHRGEHGASR